MSLLPIKYVLKEGVENLRIEFAHPGRDTVVKIGADEWPYTTSDEGVIAHLDNQPQVEKAPASEQVTATDGAMRTAIRLGIMDLSKVEAAREDGKIVQADVEKHHRENGPQIAAPADPGPQERLETAPGGNDETGNHPRGEG